MNEQVVTKKRKKKQKTQRPYDFSKHSKRHVALQIAYLGWDYHGFTVQDTVQKTIEAALFPALMNSRLIESRETSNYHRCGRTDKGVSAFGQVISITLRSSLCCGKGLMRPGETVVTIGRQCDCGKDCDEKKELLYASMINRSLPPDIRVIAWAPVSVGFSARFDCTSRTYHYTFPAPEGRLNFEAMSEAALKLTGSHDFRNFCRPDRMRTNQTFIREVKSCLVKKLPQTDPDSPPFAQFEIVGSSFLWHQVRCLMTVLMAIGRNEEKVEVVEKMLDPEQVPEKPAYAMAADFPLSLIECKFENKGLDWIEDTEEIIKIADHLEKMWSVYAVQTRMLGELITSLRSRSSTNDQAWTGCWRSFLPPGQPKNPRSLLEGFLKRPSNNDWDEVPAKKSHIE